MFLRLKPVMVAIALIGLVSPATRGIAKEYSSAIEPERRVERASRVVVRNEFGGISVVGSDRDTVEAFATNLNSLQAVPVSISEGSSGNKRVFTVSPAESGRGVRQRINLEVKVPRYVELEPIYLRSNNISIADLDGDVELNTTSGSIYFTGAIHSEGRYRLKTLSGNLFMSIPDKVGFTAVLSAYSGLIDTDFQFPNASPTPPSRTNQRVIGKYGDGSGRIELDSFSGNIFLRKIVASSVKGCQR